jgi:uncharacterized protein YqgV (UPF0045/DUF77 family)
MRAEGSGMIVEIQVVPDPSGDHDRPYAHVDAAIAVIAASGLHYEVGALGTTVEGRPEELWPLVRGVHEACLASGARRVLTYVTVAEWAEWAEEPPSMQSLTDPHRGPR